MININMFKVLEGLALKKVREALPQKMSKYRLGKLLNVEQKRISVWENGKADMRLYTLYQIAEALNVPPSQILQELDQLIKNCETISTLPEAANEEEV